VNDTDPMIQKMLDERYQKMTGEERLKIGFSMYDTARAIVLSSLPQDLSTEDRAVQLFLRFYEHDFSSEEREKIVEAIRERFS
jgi:hypothetical protein